MCKKSLFSTTFLTNSLKSVSVWVLLSCQNISSAGPLIPFHQGEERTDLLPKMKLLLLEVTLYHMSKKKKDTFLLLRSHFLLGLLWEEDVARFGMVELSGSLFDVRVRDRERGGEKREGERGQRVKTEWSGFQCWGIKLLWFSSSVSLIHIPRPACLPR